MVTGIALGDPIRFDLRKHTPNYKAFDESKFDHLGNATKFVKVQKHFEILAKEQSSKLKNKFSELIGDGEGFRVDMKNVLNSQYLSEIYFGTPISQPATVVFDTGSNWVTVTSDLCGNC